MSFANPRASTKRIGHIAYSCTVFVLNYPSNSAFSLSLFLSFLLVLLFYSFSELILVSFRLVVLYLITA